MTSTVDSLIQTELDRLSTQHDIQIILAIESGSRAWVFPSRDSDYDVRIIYLHKSHWYLSVFEKKDTLNEPINGDLDIAGWDLRKTLSLLHKGNAVVHEWLNSPIIYRQNDALLKPLASFARSAFNPSAAFGHYFHMSCNKLEMLGREPMSGKAFLYGLRTLLCARWIRDFAEAPPMAFDRLVKQYVREDKLDYELRALLAHKRDDVEAGAASVSSGLVDFCAGSLVELEESKGRVVEKSQPTEDFDDPFARALYFGAHDFDAIELLRTHLDQLPATAYQIFD